MSDELIGQALVPYYRQILPVFRLFYNKNANLGDKIEYSQRKNNNLGDLIEQSLELMEKTGGEVFFYYYFCINFLIKIKLGRVFEYKIHDSDL